MKKLFVIIVVMGCLMIGSTRADDPIMACYDTTGVISRAPSLDVGEDGRIHICWQEKRGEDSFTCYRCYHPNGSPTPTYTPSLIMNVSNDAGLIRCNDYKTGQTSHLVVDDADTLASVVFYQRNVHKYWGTEQAALFVANDISPDFTAPTTTPTPVGSETPVPPVYQEAVAHLESVGGMAEHIKDNFAIYHPTLEEIVVFWSQHQRMNDYDHDIYCNYRDIVDPAGAGGNPITGWHYIVKATDSPAWALEFWPSVAVNDSGISGMDGEMYIVSEDYDVARYTATPTNTPGPQTPTATPTKTPNPLTPTMPPSGYDDAPTEDDGALFFTRFNLTPTPCSVTVHIETTKGEFEHAAKRASVAYYFIDETPPDFDKHYLVVSYIEVPHWSTEDFYLKFTKNDLNNQLVSWHEYEYYTPIPVNYSPAGGNRPTIDVDSSGLFRCAYIGSDNRIYETNAIFGDDDWSTPQVLVNTTTDKLNIDFKIDPLDDNVYYLVYDECVDDEWRVYWQRFTE